ncbi:PIR protein [Plasmodium yoelii]|uniref:PIR protein n=2 Tax=Plasmodium yoelii TaxID=5861 RepID=A0AAE9WMV2_PLAYO|nr:PIR protein [Plasmodium yoelii]WBY55445.1 PIR protein [Plasmodium yoelii yoelii]CDU16593.1 YIR protein [Plasmodium yoelii]VTZ73528.1 PIR protein [Plasmodium yoelii]|eukprot:XP_022811604.1 PIR protein [Plasmodium yoelii]
MLTSNVCGQFENMRKFFLDELSDSGNYIFTKNFFKEYCSDNNCDSDINKIDAGCLWLFNKFYGNRNSFSNYADDKVDIVVYFMMWLAYKLNQKSNAQFPNLNEFYSKYMQNADEYKKPINGVTGYTSYIDLINKHNYLVNISNENLSKFYDLFKKLCNMINNSDKRETYLEKANEFGVEYEKLFNVNVNDTEDSSYTRILSILSNDYTNYGKTIANPKMRNILPKLVTEKKISQVSESSPNDTQMDVSSSGISTSISGIEVSSSETEPSDSDSVSPSSSILNKLILIPIIFVATLISLGIAYKYSLFGFRKRSQKQYLREKLKN